MNRIITRGLGTSHLIITRGFGGAEIPTPTPAQGGGFVKPRKIEKELMFDIISKVLFNRQEDYKILGRVFRKSERNILIRSNVLFEKSEDILIKSKVLYNKEFNSKIISKIDKTKLINILKAI